MRHLYTSTPTKQSTYPPNVPFIDPMVDSVYSKMYWENNPLKLYHPEMQRVQQLGMRTTSFTVWIIIWMMYHIKASTQQKNVILESTWKNDINRQQNTSRNFSGTTATLTNAIRFSVSPGKMTAHLQINYIMEKSHPQMIKEYEEQVK